MGDKYSIPILSIDLLIDKNNNNMIMIIDTINASKCLKPMCLHWYVHRE